MLELFKAEFSRYRKGAIWLFVLQLVAWIFVARIKPILAASDNQAIVTQLSFLFFSLAFGLVQMFFYKRKNHWTYLIHRPLSCSKIYLALTAASFVNILIAVPLAWLIVVASLDLFTNTVVDMRHYYYAIFITGASMFSYLIGHLVMLSPSRGAILTGLGIMMMNLASEDRIVLFFVIISLKISCMICLNIKSFKPDLSQHLKSGFATACMALPMQIMIVILLHISTGVFYHFPLIIMGTHPIQNPVESSYDYFPVEGSYDYFQHMALKERIRFLLKDSDAENKEMLVRQIEILSLRIDTRARNFASKGQFHFKDKENKIISTDRSSRWTFSHDEMLLQGIDQSSGEIIGWLGQNGFIDDAKAVTEADRFQSVAFTVGNQYIVTEKKILAVDWKNKLIVVKFEVFNDERLIGILQAIHEHRAIVSTQKIYIFKYSDFNYSEMKPAVAAYQFPHPVSLEQMADIEINRMAADKTNMWGDGFLLLYGGEHYNGFDHAGAEIVYAALGGDVQKIHRVGFDIHQYPAFIRHFKYMVSPVLYMLNSKVFHILHWDETENFSSHGIHDWQSPELMNKPRSVIVGIIVLQLFSTVIVFLLTRRIRLSSGKTGLWTTMAALLGLPALISFLLLNKVRRA